MAKKLYNSFIEYLIVIGFDQETGLMTSESLSDEVCIIQGHIKIYSISNLFLCAQTNLTDVWNMTFQPTVLASINNENAVFPKRMNRKSNFYPPPNLKKSLTAKVVIFVKIIIFKQNS